MKYQSSDELRQSFLEFFRRKGHTVLDCASLVPNNDPTLLWINSGVATLKPYFSGQEVPPNPRLASSQKSIRTNDIDNVGRTARHHTLFEMLGNFSIGEYFKVEAIMWAWEYMTEVVGFAPSSLWVTIHPEDTEALSIWTEQVGLPAERVILLADNFWDIGPGPCGPNSEIYFDRGPAYSCSQDVCLPGCDCERYLEVWNLVFSQFNHNDDHTYTPLPRKNIDTGMGLERLASIVQGVPTNYGTDLFMPYIRHVEQLSGHGYSQDDHKMAMNVIADHVRAVVMAVSDGVLPTNEGRGYVIRRLLRRAVRFGKTLGLQEPFLCDMVPLVANVMRVPFPEIQERVPYVSRVVRLEEERFLETLDDGTALFLSMAKILREQDTNVISGEQAFRLYDTFGFPLDLTVDLAREQGFIVEQEGFAKAMSAQRERARAARSEQSGDFGKTNLFPELPSTKFSGHTATESSGTVLGLLQGEHKVQELQAGSRGAVLLDGTSFYTESGGQAGDSGVITFPGGDFKVENTIKYYGDLALHLGSVTSGVLAVGQRVQCLVATDRRAALARAHTATHLLHAALRQILGAHVHQAGSLVEPDRLRFDFSHLSALTEEEIKAVEEQVNYNVLSSLPVHSEEMSLSKAKERGATALFGEKYSDNVRVVGVGEVSLELCGGTHLANSAAVGLCLLLGEGGIGAGLRRVEAVTGLLAYRLVQERTALLQGVADELKTTPDEALRRLDSIMQHSKEVEREFARLQGKLAGLQAVEYVATAPLVAGIKVVARQVEVRDMETLRATADAVKNKLSSGVIVLGAVHDGKVSLVSMVSDDLISRGLHAGNLVREVAKRTGGSGGGKPTMAQAGGKDPASLPDALQAVLALVEAQLKI
ncbi:MAG: Alanine--tRNA ligase [Firmicutes bacterium]|nr:Alanine--tRNA ligase [Bacillota bacterium]